jgi:protein TonB
MTVGLLFVMQSLITLQPAALVEPTKGIGVDWIKMKIPDPPVVPAQEPIEKKKLTETTEPPERQFANGGNETLTIPAYSAAPPTKYGTPDFSKPSDGPLVALVRVSPEYPARARAKGIEGQVLVQFDVTEHGYAVNVVVLESTNSIFDNAAVTAAKRFKFKARVVNGQTLPSYGIRNVFTFQMDEQ